jgi:hypothetical protein
MYPKFHYYLTSLLSQNYPMNQNFLMYPMFLRYH